MQAQALIWLGPDQAGVVVEEALVMGFFFFVLKKDDAVAGYHPKEDARVVSHEPCSDLHHSVSAHSPTQQNRHIPLDSFVFCCHCHSRSNLMGVGKKKRR